MVWLRIGRLDHRIGWLLVARVILGVGERPLIPPTPESGASFPEHRRGLANALVDAGSKIGPAISTLAGVC